jgi:hypothetical protein
MKLTIEEKCGEWLVGMEDGENIWPTTSYSTKRLAMARVLQLLDLGPVGPQMHPERICIGEFSEAGRSC